MNINAFKVVDKETRHGTNWGIYHGHLERVLRLDNPKYRQDTLDALEKAEKFEIAFQQFFPIYERDAIIEMAPTTVGLMVFESHDF